MAKGAAGMVVFVCVIISFWLEASTSRNYE